MALVLTATMAIPAQAHSGHEIERWVEQWIDRVEDHGLEPGMLREMDRFVRNHSWYFHPQPTQSAPSVYRGMGTNVERWRGLVVAYFPAEAVDTMMCIMAGESGGNPNARNSSSGAAGLFQVMPFWWSHYGGDRYDPETNVRVARLIWDQQGYGAWSVWNRGKC